MDRKMDKKSLAEAIVSEHADFLLSELADVCQPGDAELRHAKTLLKRIHRILTAIEQGEHLGYEERVVYEEGTASENVIPDDIEEEGGADEPTHRPRNSRDYESLPHDNGGK